MINTNINLFGGPGTGKSTIAAGIFHIMKINGYNIEYIQEYAKDLTYGKDFTKLSDQLLILGEQHHRMHRMIGQVEYIVHDSPFIMGLIYHDGPHKDAYTNLVTDMFNGYKNINIFLERNIEEHPYQEQGRSQDLSEAICVDEKIKDMLNTHNIEFHNVLNGAHAIDNIMKIIKDNT